MYQKHDIGSDVHCSQWRSSLAHIAIFWFATTHSVTFGVWTNCGARLILDGSSCNSIRGSFECCMTKNRFTGIQIFSDILSNIYFEPLLCDERRLSASTRRRLQQRWFVSIYVVECTVVIILSELRMNDQLVLQFLAQVRYFVKARGRKRQGSALWTLCILLLCRLQIYRPWIDRLPN